MRFVWSGSLAFWLSLSGALLHADDTVSSSAPVVTLGRPVPIFDGAPSPVGDAVRPAAYNEPSPSTAHYQPPDMPPPSLPPSPVPPPPTLAMPPPPIPSSSPLPPNEQYNCGVATTGPAPSHPIWEGTKNLFSWIPGIGGESFDGSSHHLFESDHCFDEFISPVTNPFLFEDPRSLTEVRPLFIYQQAPSKNPIFHAGDIEFLGLEARLAITERLSFVMSELGWVWMEPHTGTPDFNTHDGFAQIRLGPKFTFLRCENTGSVAAAGLNFELPVGDHRVLQDTGTLSLEPYVTAQQRLWRTSYGTLNGMATIGYDVGVDDKRSDFLFTSWHLDFDVGNLKRIYPLVELHWFHYTSSGKAENINFEGADLFNFGAQHIAGQDNVSLAFGARFKVNEVIQLGSAFEFGLTNHHDLQDFRITFDVIFRY